MNIIAHRGVHKEHPENTMAAFQAAIDMGCDGIETDVRISGDNTPILFHDSTINDIPVSNLSRSEISELAGYEVPRLKHLLKTLPDGFFLNLELKSKDVYVAVKELTTKYSNINYLVTSFWHNLLDFSCKRGILISHRPQSIEAFKAMVPDGVEYIVWDHEKYDLDFVEELIDYKHLIYGIKRNVKVPDNLEGIITDYPEDYIQNGMCAP